MGLISSRAVIDAATQVDDTIIKTHLGPNRSFRNFTPTSAVRFAQIADIPQRFGELAKSTLLRRSSRPKQ
jgi:hypothetical protein